jgi:hypothetical protein
MKRAFIYLYVLLLCSSFFLSAVPASVADNGWVVDGSKVYINDARVYLEADPHTIASPGWVTFTLQSKQYTGDIDVVWGFDTTTVKPSKAEIYKPYYNNWTTNSSETFYYVSSFVLAPPDASCDYGFSYDAKHYQVNHAVPQYDEEGNITGWQPTTSIVCFDNYSKNGVNYTVTWHEEHSQYIEWQSFTGDFQKIQQDHGGMNTWYVLRNVPVEAGKEYVIRAWIDVPISTQGVSGKYWWCLKPSALSLNEAIAQDKFYSLDPWYNVAYSHRKTVRIINPTAETLTDFPAFVNVSWESEMQNDFDDVTFTSLSNTLLPFELDDYADSDYGLYWVNETIPASSYVDVYMYYGNPGASSLQNIEGTWNSNYVMVQHLKDGVDNAHTTDSTAFSNDGTKLAPGEPAETAAGAVGRAQDFDGANDYINCGNQDSLNTVSAFTLEAWPNADAITGFHQTFSKGRFWVSGGQYSFRYTKTGIYYDFGVGVRSSDNIASKEIYYKYDPLLGNTNYVVGVFNGSSQRINLYLNGGYVNGIDTGFSSMYSAAHDVFLGRLSDISSYWFNGTLDEIRISNVARSPSWILSSYEFVVNQSTYVTWGGATTCPCPPTIANETGNFWVNFTFTPDDLGCPLTTDGYNVSWSNGTDSGWYNNTDSWLFLETPPCTWINITAWGYNTTGDYLSCDSTTANIYFDFPPPAVTNETGNFFVNFSFDAGDYADATDGYNISWIDDTGSGWVNTTDSYLNFSYSPHETVYVNITVWAWNASWGVWSCDYVTASARLPNNAPLISGCDNVTFDPTNKTVYIYLNYTDLDGDVCLFSTDFPYGSLNASTGIFVWVINGTMSEYYASFTVNDSYGGSSTCVASLMQIYLYFQSLSVTEEQEMLADMWLYLVFSIICCILLFGAFFARRGEYFVHIIMSIVSCILAFLLALYSPTEEIGHPELAYIFTLLGIIALLATAVFITDILLDVFPVTAKRKEEREEHARQLAEERFFGGP